jgi:hypothetical protein
MNHSPQNGMLLETKSVNWHGWRNKWAKLTVTFQSIILLWMRIAFSTIKATYYDRVLNHDPQERMPVKPTVCYTVTINYELTGMENEVGIPTNIPVQHTPNINKTKMY